MVNLNPSCEEHLLGRPAPRTRSVSHTALWKVDSVTLSFWRAGEPVAGGWQEAQGYGPVSSLLHLEGAPCPTPATQRV